jgi:dynein heavy chain 1
MSPKESGLSDQAATSPALFNRCVLNWFGDWSNNSFYQAGLQLTSNLDMNRPEYDPPMSLHRCCDLIGERVEYQQAVVNSFVHIHDTVRRIIDIERKKNHQTMTLSPRHFLDFISHYSKLFHEKRDELEEEQRHLDIGLQKISETEEQVKINLNFLIMRKFVGQRSPEIIENQAQ